MYDPVVVLRFYSSVLHEHKNKYGVSDTDIRTAIQNMKEVYKPNPGSLSDTFVYVADYNDAAHRCAYLHKYAPFHTALVADMLGKALQQNLKVFQDLFYSSGPVNICSLGGGPGSDIFGVLSVLNATFGLFPVSATVIDCMENWKDLFYELINELRYGNYGALGESLNEQYFDWKYLQHNLLAKMTDQVNTAIGKANLVTMIKFISASSCKDTSAMIKKILACMKPGALVVYIDNAGGGFHKLVAKEAEDCKFKSVFYMIHKTFIEPALNVKNFGHAPCYESRVSFHIWRKAFPKKRSYSVPNYSLKEQNFSPLSTNAILLPKKYEYQLHNESHVINKWVSVTSTSAGLFSKIMDKDHNDLFREIEYSNYSANTHFTSNAMSRRMLGNSSQILKKTYPRKIPVEESVKYISREITNVDFLDKQLQVQQNAISINASNTKKIKISKKLLYKLSEPQKELYSRGIIAEESIEFEIAKSNFYANCTDFASTKLHSKHRTCPANTSSLNAMTCECTRNKSSKFQTSTDRTPVAALKSLPNNNSSTRLSWWDYMRGMLCQEFIGLITGEFIDTFQEQEMFIIGATVAEKFHAYLFENMM